MSRFATSNNRTPSSTKKKKLAAGAVVSSNVPVKRRASKTASTTNLAGGKAFKMSDKMEFVTACACGLLRGKGNPQRMYESEDQRIARLTSLIPKVGAEFAAKTALSMRIQHGQRSISHLIASLVLDTGRGEEWLAPFYKQVSVRADDPSEIIGAYWQRTNRKGFVPNSMKKGFAAAFDKWDSYRLAKYAGGQRSPSLIDVVNLVHPKPTEKNRKALKALVAGELKNTDTWEAKLSAAGQEGNETTKADAWKEMIDDGKMGQLGLLRNLRNIALNCDTTTIKKALKQLTDKEAIKKSGILPMQYLKAYEVISELSGNRQHAEAIKAAIDDAVEIAAGNVPSLGDNVLCAIDESGSMGQIERDNAAMFAAVMLKANPDADLMYFASKARYQTFNRKLPIMELMTAIKNGMSSGGTDFNTIFTTANKNYDSIVILSDGEGWMNGGAPIGTQAAYEKKFNCKPTIFSFDLGGDGSLMFREDGIILLAGYSFHVFKLLNFLKVNRVKLIDEIDKIVIGQPLPTYDEEEEND